jgi:hypothetical protein
MDNKEVERILDNGLFLQIETRSRLANIVKRKAEVDDAKPRSFLISWIVG